MNNNAQPASCCSHAMKKPTLKITTTPELCAAVLCREKCEEHWVSVVRKAGEPHDALLERAAHYVSKAGATIVSLEVLGPPPAKTEIQALERVFGPVNWPVATLGGTGNSDDPAAVQVWAVRGPEVRPVQRAGRIYGAVFEDSWARFCRLGGMTPLETSMPPAEQTAWLLQCMDKTLDAASMVFADTARTWYYNKDILRWYDDFNTVRNQFFDEHRVFDGIMPASTGVGAVPPNKAAITGGLIGIQSKSGEFRISAAPSPLQCAAAEYGSSFSRAVLVTFPDHERLFISGTASISREGLTTCADSVDAQIEKTMAVVEAILNASGMNWSAVTRGIAYLKNAKDVSRFNEYRLRAGLKQLPLAIMVADICRDDLLFEIEADAVRVR